jgi:hypothetical protein
MKMEINLYVKGYKHLKDISCYNYNFYEIRFDPYFNLIEENNILLEECHEDDGYFTFSLGHFDENGKFIKVIMWDDDTIDDGIKSLIN